MLDIFDFIVEKGGDPKKIKESQRRRYAPEEAVDEVIALYEDHRKSTYSFLSQCKSKFWLIPSLYSSVLCDANKHEDQRCPEADWYQAKGQGECG